MKINLGGIKGEMPGFMIVGLGDDAAVQVDLNNDFPFKDETVSEIHASHILEHVNDPLKFLAECYRIMKVGAKLTIKVPHVNNHKGAFCNMEHKHFFNEYAIRSITGEETSIFPHKFTHINTTIKRGRFLFWQKREIYWTVMK